MSLSGLLLGSKPRKIATGVATLALAAGVAYAVWDWVAAKAELAEARQEIQGLEQDYSELRKRAQDAQAAAEDLRRRRDNLDAQVGEWKRKYEEAKRDDTGLRAWANRPLAGYIADGMRVMAGRVNVGGKDGGDGDDAGGAGDQAASGAEP